MVIALTFVAIFAFLAGQVLQSSGLVSIGIAGISALFVYGFITAASSWLVALAVFFYVGLILTELTSR